MLHCSIVLQNHPRSKQLKIRRQRGGVDKLHRESQIGGLWRYHARIIGSAA